MGNTTTLVNHLTLRRAVGFLGLSLPITLPLGTILFFEAEGLADSLSAYYYTGMGDVFVGTLCALGLVLFCYKGYEAKDDWAGDLACYAVIGVALFPKAPTDPTDLQTLIGYIHRGCAAVFFLTLAYFSYCLFTKTDPSMTPTPRAQKRILIYRICGVVILASISLIALIFLFFPEIKKTANSYIFWLETIAVFAFSFSWLVKGKALLADK